MFGTFGSAGCTMLEIVLLLCGDWACNCVQYVGSMQVLESMKALDFDTRTMITKYVQLGCGIINL